MHALFTLFAVVAVASSAGANVVYESARRTTYARVIEGERTDMTLDVGPWSSETYLEYTDAAHSPGYPTWARGIQQSVIGPDYIVASGHQAGYDGYAFGGFGTGIGASSVEAIFVVDQETPYAFSMVWGIVSTSFAIAGQATLERLDDPDTVFNMPIWESEALYLGTLAPGRYRLAVGHSAGWTGSGTGLGESFYAFAFTVPAPWSAVAFAGLLMARARRTTGSCYPCNRCRFGIDSTPSPSHRAHVAIAPVSCPSCLGQLLTGARVTV